MSFFSAHKWERNRKSVIDKKRHHNEWIYEWMKLAEKKEANKNGEIDGEKMKRKVNLAG